MSQTLACYKEILPAFSCRPDEEGFIDFLSVTGTSKPATIGGAKLVLPTTANLRKGFGEEQIPFHPLCESMSRQGTSPVIQYLQRSAKANISHVLVCMASSLLAISTDVASHKDIPPDCTDFLVKLADVDKEKKIQEVFEKVIAAAVKKNRLITVYLKNGGTFDGTKVNRMCVIRVPLLEDLQGEGKDVLGVTITKRQRKILTALFKLIVPFGDNPEEYSHGTTSRHAPYLHCLLVAYAKMIKVLNQCVNAYAVPLQLPVKAIPTFDPEIVKTFEACRAEVDIPPLRGNEGGAQETAEEASDTAKAPAVTQAKATVVQSSRDSAVLAPAKVEQVSRPGTVSMAEFSKANNPQPGLVNVGFDNNQQSNLNGSFGTANFGSQPNFGSQGTSLFGNNTQQQGVNLPWNSQPAPVKSLFGGPSPSNHFQQQSSFGQQNRSGGLGLI